LLYSTESKQKQLEIWGRAQREAARCHMGRQFRGLKFRSEQRHVARTQSHNNISPDQHGFFKKAVYVH